jgi:hypothetical protein
MKEKCKVLHVRNTIKLEDRFILIKVQANCRQTDNVYHFMSFMSFKLM